MQICRLFDLVVELTADAGKADAGKADAGKADAAEYTIRAARGAGPRRGPGERAEVAGNRGREARQGYQAGLTTCESGSKGIRAGNGFREKK